MKYAHTHESAGRMLAWDAMKLMEADPKKRIMMLPILDANQCVIGLIHLHDIIQGGL